MFLIILFSSLNYSPPSFKYFYCKAHRELVDLTPYNYNNNNNNNILLLLLLLLLLKISTAQLLLILLFLPFLLIIDFLYGN